MQKYTLLSKSRYISLKLRKTSQKKKDQKKRWVLSIGMGLWVFGCPAEQKEKDETGTRTRALPQRQRQGPKTRTKDKGKHNGTIALARLLVFFFFLICIWSSSNCKCTVPRMLSPTLTAHSMHHNILPSLLLSTQQTAGKEQAKSGCSMGARACVYLRGA